MLKHTSRYHRLHPPFVAGVVLVGITGWLTGVFWLTPAQAARRPGAPRPLRLIWPQEQQPGALLLAGVNPSANSEGVLVEHGGAAQDTLFFTHQADGTRNIWRAEAQPPAGQDANATNGMADRATRWPSLAWPATPVTRFVAPLFAAQPAITPDGRTLLCATNAFVGTGAAQLTHTQIARLDLASGRWTTLTPNDADDHAPTLAPDGHDFAFVSSRSGLESIYVMPLEGGPARRVVTLGRAPCWLDNNTLLFESVRPGQSGLYQVTLASEGVNGSAAARLFFDRAGAATSAPDGQQLCIAAVPDPSASRRAAPNTPAAVLLPQLYLLASNGAGAHAIPGTDGASAPRFTPDGSAIIYDALLDSVDGASVGITSGASSGPTRTLWLMPMLRVPPTARLLNIKPIIDAVNTAPATNVPVSDPAAGVAVNTIEVVGTAFAEGSAPVVKLEYGEGSAPTQWHDLTVRPGAVQEGRLAIWKLPSGAQGDWTLRLTVTDATHDQAQTTLPVTLPIYAPLPEKLPPTNAPPDSAGPLVAGGPAWPGTSGAQPASPEVSPGDTTPGSVTHSAVATTITPPAITSRHAATPGTVPRKVGVRRAAIPGVPPSRPLRLASAVKNLPLPALPPAPTPTSPGNSGAAHNPSPTTTPNSLPTFPQDTPGPAAPPYIPPDASSTTPTPKPPRKRRPPRHTHTPRLVSKTPSHTARSGDSSRAPDSNTATSGDTINANGEDAARLSVVGTPAVLETGQNVDVTVTLRNTGTRAWATESGQPVRLVYRWVDAVTGTRTRWAVRWLQGNVAPGSSAQLAVTVAAPPRPGRYRLTYVLVRLNGDKFEPPPATTPGQRWPGEFGSITYGVTVRAGERAAPVLPDNTR